MGMERPRAVKVKEAVEYIERDGWYLVAVKGDHRQYVHHTKTGKVTVPGKLSADIATGTAHNIFKQAQIPWPKGKQ